LVLFWRGQLISFYNPGFLTGILLLLYYRVGEDSSYESVQFIVSKVKFGWLIRSIHSWSANLMILACFHTYV
jgi:cytochrome b6